MVARPRSRSTGGTEKGEGEGPRRAPTRLPDWDPSALDVTALWLARSVVLSGRAKACAIDEDDDGDLLALLGLTHFAELARPAARAERDFRARLEALEAEPRRREGLVLRNTEALGDLLALGRVERDVVAFAVTLETYVDAQGAFYRRPPDRVRALLSGVLEAEPAALRAALSPSGTLALTGLVQLSEEAERARRGDPRDRHWPFAVVDGLRAILEVEYDRPEDLLTNFFKPSPAASLTAADFPHAGRDVGMLGRLLSAAVERRTRGVNVLVHGAPGTGKTELARALAAQAGAGLYEVNVESLAGAPMDRAARFASYQFCQRMLAARGGLVLFDEIEDVFPDAARGPFEAEQGSGADKGWTNRLLEGNPVPTLWLSNRIRQMDPAFLRRFDFVFELRTPPAPVRRRILADRLGPLGVSPAWLDAAAGDERLTPAHIDRAARVAALVDPGEGAALEACLSHVIDNALLAGTSGAMPSPPSPLAYEPSLLNASEDLGRLADGIVRRAAQGRPVRGAICLYGPPGTGKTAFARHLAERLGRPLLARRASELLGSLVGQTERALAKAFQQARAEGAVLLLDEVDSFLQNRRGAGQQWEVTQVNELLVQMEAFDGLLLCATNLFDRLDEAALRRFAAKVRFDPLRPEQREALFLRTLGLLDGPSAPVELGPEVRSALGRLGPLTPGDFAAVLRKGALMDLGEGPGALLEALGAELRARGLLTRAPVGFGSH